MKLLFLLLLIPSLASAQLVNGTLVNGTLVNAQPFVDTNLVLWLLPSSASSVGDGNPVSTWTDGGVWGNSVTAAGSARAVYTNNVVGTGKKGMIFDGSSTSMAIPINSTVNIQGDLTLAAWVYTGASANMQFIQGYDLSAPNNGYGMDIGFNAADKYGVYTDTSSRHGGTTSITLNAWNHVAVTVTGGTASFYLAGVANGTASQLSPSSYTGARNIGGSSGQFFTGFLRDVRIYSRALSSGQIQDIYNANLD